MYKTEDKLPIVTSCAMNLNKSIFLHFASIVQALHDALRKEGGAKIALYVTVKNRKRDREGLEYRLPQLKWEF